MRGLLRSLIVGIVVFAIALAIWRIFGGDVGGFLEAIWAFLWTIILGVSNVLIEIFKVFGFGG